MKGNGVKKSIIWLLIAGLLFTEIVVCKNAEAAVTSTKSYMVYFDSNGGSDCGYLVGIPENTYITLPKPVKKGYSFEGWYTDSQYTEEFTNYTKVTQNLVLYAKWEQMYITKIDVTYNGEPVILNRRPEKKNFVVKVYYYDGSYEYITDFTLEDDIIDEIGDNYVTVNVTNDEGELEASAWVTVKGMEEPLYYVIFDTQGGSSVKPVSGIHVNTYVQFPGEPTKTGYLFDGWYMDKAYTKEFTETTPITESIIVYAKWEPESSEQEKEAIALNTTRMNLKLNETQAVFVETLDPYLDVLYSSDDSSIAKVDEDGIVTGVKNGRTIINAYVWDTGEFFECEVGVGSKQYIQKIQTNVSAKRVKKGSTFQIKTTITPSGVTQKYITYTSSNKSVATVSSTGLIKAKKKGVCYITVKTKDGSNLTKTIKIRVV